jgi:hypothetical protein
VSLKIVEYADEIVPGVRRPEEASTGRHAELLKTAMAEAATLPEAAQDEIGRGLLTYIEKLRSSRRVALGI